MNRKQTIKFLNAQFRKVNAKIDAMIILGTDKTDPKKYRALCTEHLRLLAAWNKVNG